MSADFGGFQTKEAQSKALSKAIRDSQQTYSNEWKKYSKKPWVKRATNENLSDSQLSQKLLNEKKLDDAMKRLDEIDTQILDIQARKDELKSIESMKVNPRTNIQVKMVSNQAYQTLLAKEQSLESERNKLTNQVQKYQNNMDKIDLASQTGKIFSAGIKMEPAMDTGSRDVAPVTSGAMSPADRAEAYDKQGSLIDPNFSLVDFASGMKDQGESYIGGKQTMLDRAIFAPIHDVSEAIFNPEQHQMNVDYGYTNTNNSIKEILDNPSKFAGNVATEAVVAVGTLGVGKGGSSGIKLLSTYLKSVKGDDTLKVFSDIQPIISKSDEVKKIGNITDEEYKTLQNVAKDFIQDDPAPHKKKFVDQQVRLTSEGDVIYGNDMKVQTPKMVDGELRLVEDISVESKQISKDVLEQVYSDAKNNIKINAKLDDIRGSSHLADRTSIQKINPPVTNIANAQKKIERFINKLNPLWGAGNNIKLDGTIKGQVSGYVKASDPNTIYLNKNSLGTTPENFVNTINHESLHNVLNKKIGIVSASQMDNIAYASRKMDKELHRIGVQGTWGKIGFDHITANTKYLTNDAKIMNEMNYSIELSNQIMKNIQKNERNSQLKKIGVGTLALGGWSIGNALSKEQTKKKTKNYNKTKKPNSVFNFKY